MTSNGSAKGTGRGKPPGKATGRRPAASSRTAPTGSFETAFAALGRKADDARAHLAELTDEGAKNASRSLQKATHAAQVKVRKLNAGWKRMPPKRKAQVLAGIVGAIAAAIAVPLAVRHRRKVKSGKGEAPAEE
jgi:hypothetical protein